MCHTPKRESKACIPPVPRTKPSTACIPPVFLGPNPAPLLGCIGNGRPLTGFWTRLLATAPISTDLAPDSPGFVTKARLRLLVDSGTTVALSLATHFSSWRPGPALPCQPRCLNSLPALSLTSVAVPTVCFNSLANFCLRANQVSPNGPALSLTSVAVPTECLQTVPFNRVTELPHPQDYTSQLLQYTVLHTISYLTSYGCHRSRC